MLIHVLIVYVTFVSDSYYSKYSVPYLLILCASSSYVILVKLLFQLQYVTILFVSVILIYHVLYLKKIIVLKKTKQKTKQKNKQIYITICLTPYNPK